MTAAIDLRSDTVTRPTDAMRAAMAAAPVGDDQYGEDPTTNRLQERIAELLGKDAALWLPSGTMANQVALRVLTRPGDDVIVSRESHAVWHETGGSAANAGVQFTEIGARGVYTVEDFLRRANRAATRSIPRRRCWRSRTRTTARAASCSRRMKWSRLCAAAREHGVATFLDGARLWNAAVASGQSEAQLAAPFDLVAVALSKGLGAPGGSLLAGSRELIERATRYRRMFGGAMRQVGIYAAAGLYALDHHRTRLVEDHANTRRLATVLAQHPRVDLDLSSVQTNIIVFRLKDGAPDAAKVVERARERGVLLFPFGARTLRAVTHLDVSAAQCERAAAILCDII